MSVLNRKELEDSPLADLHQIASELGLEAYRSKRKDDLIATILGASGVEEESASTAPATGAERVEEEDTSEDTSDDTSEGTSDDDVDEVPAVEARQPPTSTRFR